MSARRRSLPPSDVSPLTLQAKNISHKYKICRTLPTFSGDKYHIWRYRSSGFGQIRPVSSQLRRFFEAKKLKSGYYQVTPALPVPGRPNWTRCRQQPITATLPRSCIARALSREDGPVACYTLRSNIASIIKISFSDEAVG